MVQNNHSSAIYVRPEIMDKVDKFVAENKEIYRSRSQLINSLLYKFLREQGIVPKEENQTCRTS